MPNVLPLAKSYSGKSFANAKGETHCVEFIRQSLKAPHTSQWREGAKIQKLPAGTPDPVATGTAIATFVHGEYPQNGSTGKHAAIYMGQNEEGIQVLDQWKSQGQVLPRTIPWKPRRAGLSNDASAFSVLEYHNLPEP